jgi:hypothetical protein
MLKSSKRRWAWSLLAVCLIGPVIVFWLLPLALFRLERQSNGVKIPQAETGRRDNFAEALIERPEFEQVADDDAASRGRIIQRTKAAIPGHEQWRGANVSPADREVGRGSGGDVFREDTWKTYLRDLTEADGIPDRELKALRRDIHLMGLPDPARIPYDIGR